MGGIDMKPIWEYKATYTILEDQINVRFEIDKSDFEMNMNSSQIKAVAFLVAAMLIRGKGYSPNNLSLYSQDNFGFDKYGWVATSDILKEPDERIWWREGEMSDELKRVISWK